MGALIEFREVCKYYQMGDTTVKAADHISFQVQTQRCGEPGRHRLNHR